MAKVQQVSGVNVTNITSQQYATLGQVNLFFAVTESFARVLYRTAGTLSHLLVYISINATTGTSTVRTRKNGSTNGNLVASIGAGLTGKFEDTGNTDAVSDGDDWYYSATPGSLANLRVAYAATLFDSSTNTVDRIIQARAIAFSTASTTNYFALVGSSLQTATEADTQFKFKTAGTLRNLQVNVTGNTRASSATDFGTRIDTGPGAMSVSVAASTTGIFEDTSNEDTIAVDTLGNFHITTGAGTGTITSRTHATEFETTDSTWHFANHLGGLAQNQAITNYATPSGQNANGTSSAETAVKVAANLDLTIEKLTGYFSANTLNNGATFSVMVDGSASALSIAIPASTTGLFEDASTVSIVAANEISYELIAAAGTGAITSQIYGILATTVPPPPPTFRDPTLRTIIGPGLTRPAY